ncbi:MAG: hypothetical protein IJ590_03330 [Rickettsiales bacterium]|nr:hypothetical protein [Rickettsiales bacterium]
MSEATSTTNSVKTVDDAISRIASAIIAKTMSKGTVPQIISGASMNKRVKLSGSFQEDDKVKVYFNNKLNKKQVEMAIARSLSKPRRITQSGFEFICNMCSSQNKNDGDNVLYLNAYNPNVKRNNYLRYQFRTADEAKKYAEAWVATQEYKGNKASFVKSDSGQLMIIGYNSSKISTDRQTDDPDDTNVDDLPKPKQVQPGSDVVLDGGEKDTVGVYDFRKNIITNTNPFYQLYLDCQKASPPFDIFSVNKKLDDDVEIPHLDMLKTAERMNNGLCFNSLGRKIGNALSDISCKNGGRFPIIKELIKIVLGEHFKDVRYDKDKNRIYLPEYAFGNVRHFVSTDSMIETNDNSIYKKYILTILKQIQVGDFQIRNDRELIFLAIQRINADFSALAAALGKPRLKNDYMQTLLAYSQLKGAGIPEDYGDLGLQFSKSSTISSLNQYNQEQGLEYVFPGQPLLFKTEESGIIDDHVSDENKLRQFSYAAKLAALDGRHFPCNDKKTNDYYLNHAYYFYLVRMKGLIPGKDIIKFQLSNDLQDGNSGEDEDVYTNPELTVDDFVADILNFAMSDDPANYNFNLDPNKCPDKLIKLMYQKLNDKTWYCYATGVDISCYFGGNPNNSCSMNDRRQYQNVIILFLKYYSKKFDMDGENSLDMQKKALQHLEATLGEIRDDVNRTLGDNGLWTTSATDLYGYVKWHGVTNYKKIKIPKNIPIPPEVKRKVEENNRGSRMNLAYNWDDIDNTESGFGIRSGNQLEI